MAVSPIIPVDAQPMRTLTLAMAVMCYLATLALGALILVQSAVTQWTSGVSSEITVQVRALSDVDLKAETEKAVTILRRTEGIAEVRVLDAASVRKLLEPWLGDTGMIDDLPLPALVSVTVDEARPPDLDALEAQLKAEVKGASVDTHRRWRMELMRTATLLERLALAVLALIAVSAAALVVFATRSVLDANREVIEVLNLIGARDRFIARAVKGRFLRSGMIAGLAGTLGGLLTFAMLGLLDVWPAADTLSEASARLLIAAPSVAVATYAVFLLVPIVATLLSVVTAHLAVMRQLRATV